MCISEVASLGEIRGVVGDEDETKFRQLAMRKFGYGRGSLSKALAEALSGWIKDCEADLKEQGSV